jgi:hypothetical protein
MGSLLEGVREVCTVSNCIAIAIKCIAWPQAKCKSHTVISFLVLRGPGLGAPFEISQQSMIAPGFNESTHESMIFIICKTRGVGSSDASWPSKARRPVLNLWTFL